MNRSAQPLCSARDVVAGLLLAHVLAVLILAASPRLHHWVHPDADDDDHDCAVVLFLHGSSDVGPTPLIVPACAALATEFVRVVPPAEFIPSVFVANRVFEHGPPIPKQSR